MAKGTVARSTQGDLSAGMEEVGGEPRVKVSATKEDTNMSTRKER